MSQVRQRGEVRSGSNHSPEQLEEGQRGVVALRSCEAFDEQGAQVLGPGLLTQGGDEAPHLGLLGWTA